MKHSLGLSLLCVLSACKDKAEPSPSPSLPAPSATVAKGSDVATPPPTSAAPRTDGLPANVQLAAGGTLVDKTEKASGNGVWTYAYAGLEPLALAEKQRAALDGGGWKSVLRLESLADVPPPVHTVFATLDSKLIVAQATADPSGGARLKLMVEAMQGLRMDPPPDYPAGFPFLPFGIVYTPKTPPTTKQVSLVYNGNLDGLRGELAAATRAAGWDCGSATFTLLSGCRKDGKEVFVHFEAMSSNRQSLFISEL